MLAMLERGPLPSTTGPDGLTIAQAVEQMRAHQRWFDTWVKEDLLFLVPELRARQDQLERIERQRGSYSSSHACLRTTDEYIERYLTVPT